MKVRALVRVSSESAEVEGEGRGLSSLETFPGQVTSPHPHWHSEGALIGARGTSEGGDEVEGKGG